MPTRGAGSHSLESMIAAHLTELRACRRSSETLRQVRAVLQRFARQLPHRCRRDVRAITEAHVVRFLSGLSVGPGTRRTYLARLRSFFTALVRRGVVWSNPAQGVATVRDQTLPGPVPGRGQVRQLLGSAGAWRYTAERDRAVLEVLYGSGLRRSECERLDLGDVDLAEGTLWVRNGKGRKDRVVPLTARAVEALETYLRDGRPRLSGATNRGEAALFLSARGQRLGGSGVWKLVHRAARQAGIEDLTVHSLRHACATHLLRGGADVRHIQRLLGHAHVSSTVVYTRVDTRALAAMLRRCHPRERRHR